MYKILFLFLMASSLLFTSCDPDGIDETNTEKEVETKVENPILNRSITNGEGIDIGCIAILYPFQIITINGNVLDVTNDDDMDVAISDVDDYVVDFVYPLNVVDEEGETSVVNNVEELGALFGACFPDEGWGGDDFPAFLINEESSCYTIQYPLSLSDLNDNVISVENDDEFIDALATNDFLFFVFPITLVDTDGTLLSIAGEYELFEALSACQGGTGNCDSIAFGGQLACYEIQFPVSLLLTDGTTVTAENIDELNGLLFNNDVLNFAYPMNLVNLNTGEAIVVNSDEDMFVAFEACGGTWNSPLIFDFIIGNEYCFDISFPVDVVGPDGTVSTVENAEELYNASENNNDIVLPVTVTTDDGMTHEINSAEELYAVIENC